MSFSLLISSSEPEASYLLLWKHVIHGRELDQQFYYHLQQYLPCSHPTACLAAPPPFFLAAEFKLCISHFPKPFCYSICPSGQLTLHYPCPRHPHTHTHIGGRFITHRLTPGVSHINHNPLGVNRKCLKWEMKWNSLYPLERMPSDFLELPPCLCPCLNSFSCELASFASLFSLFIFCNLPQVIRDVLLLGHRQAFAWVDEWIGKCAEDDSL